jgi:hypothetical protein
VIAITVAESGVFVAAAAFRPASSVTAAAWTSVSLVML